MRRKLLWMLGLIFTMAVMLAGCGASQTAAPTVETENDAAAQTEVSSGAGAPSSQSEDEESDPVPEGSDAEEPTPGPTEPSSGPEEPAGPSQMTTDEKENADMKMNVTVGGSTFTATLERNSAVDALVAMMEDAPVTIQMSDYAGFEKVGALGTSLPASDRQTTTQAGDIVLYQGNQIVIFYGSNSWSYTRLGKIDDLTGWEEALGSGDVTVTFSLEA